LQGQGNTSLESNHLLWAISRQLTSHDLANLQAGAWEEITPAAQAALQAYTSRFGGGQEQARQRAMRLVAHYAQKQVDDPLATSEQLAAERERFSAEVHSLFTGQERERFDELLACALANHRLTEDHNYWLDNLSDQATKRVCAEMTQRLLQANSLAQVEDADYLTVHEMILWGYGLADPLRPRIAARRAEYEHYAKLPVPDYLGQPPQPMPWTDRFGGPAVPLEGAPDEIRGVGASAGRATARARVVTTLDDAMHLQPGEVLVCPATDPSWTPLFALASALVTDSGGSLSHAAVVAREYRLPTVTGTHLATKRIQNGQMVEVDGTTGVVKLLNQ
jgi:pyruvate,water dikinase